MKTLYVIRGPFGFHKTEFAKSICDTVVSCWDYYDMYGESQFNEKLKPHADAYCQHRTRMLLTHGDCERVAIANSLTKLSDLTPYKEMAKEFGYRIFIVIADNEITEESRRDAPEDVVKRQAQNLEHNAFADTESVMWV